jgi:hypothetical protein
MPWLRRFAFALLAVFVVVPAAQAWGPLGHRVVADIAQQHLTPAALAQVRQLLAPDHTTQLADVASWADDLRNDPAQQALWQQTRSLHYVDIHDPHCHYLPPRDCPDGQCVVSALAHYVAILADRKQPDEQRREALKFVVHFIGDMHQPLHAGYRDDKGGNDYQVQFEGKGSNLHRVWDSGLLGTRGLAAEPYAQLLDARPDGAPHDTATPDASAYAAWAEQSCRATAAPGFYPSGHVIGQAYVDVHLPLAEQRLREAGLRLASVLNGALAR